MPLAAVPLQPPPELDHLRAGDADLDGRDELVWISRHRSGDSPESVTLTLSRLGADGRELERYKVELGSRAAYWDAERGLWLLDGQGVTLLGLDGSRRRLLEGPTLLAGLGPASPRRAPLVHDLDGDGQPELLYFAGSELRAVSADGTSWGGVPVSVEGELASRRVGGATVLSAALSPPAFAVADLDGDGFRDILLPRHRRLGVYLTGPGRLGARQLRVQLPADLDPPAEERKQEGTHWVAESWFEDVDGDGRADLLLRLWVQGAGGFGSRSELRFLRGTGSRFAELQRWELDGAVVEARLRDHDGDGDLDLYLLQADLGWTSLARSLATRRARLELHLHLQDGGRFDGGRRVAELDVPLDRSEGLQWALADVDGDGLLDLAVLGEELALHRGTPGGFAGSPSATAPLPAGATRLLAVEGLDGGRSALVAWGPGGAGARLYAWR